MQIHFIVSHIMDLISIQKDYHFAHCRVVSTLSSGSSTESLLSILNDASYNELIQELSEDSDCTNEKISNVKRKIARISPDKSTPNVATLPNNNDKGQNQCDPNKEVPDDSETVAQVEPTSLDNSAAATSSISLPSSTGPAENLSSYERWLIAKMQQLSIEKQQQKQKELSEKALERDKLLSKRKNKQRAVEVYSNWRKAVIQKERLNRANQKMQVELDEQQKRDEAQKLRRQEAENLNAWLKKKSAERRLAAKKQQVEQRQAQQAAHNRRQKGEAAFERWMRRHCLWRPGSADSGDRQRQRSGGGSSDGSSGRNAATPDRATSPAASGLSDAAAPPPRVRYASAASLTSRAARRPPYFIHPAPAFVNPQPWIGPFD